MKRRRRKTEGLEKVVFPCFNNRVGYVVKRGPEQSEVQFEDDRSDVHWPHEGVFLNRQFKPYGVPRVKIPVKTKR